MKIGVYPGTFDPITNGHLDIIKRAYQLFDKLYIVVPKNIGKNALFSTDERVELIKAVLVDYPDIIVVVAYGKILPKEILEIPRLFIKFFTSSSSS